MHLTCGRAQRPLRQPGHRLGRRRKLKTSNGAQARPRTSSGRTAGVVMPSNQLELSHRACPGEPSSVANQVNARRPRHSTRRRRASNRRSPSLVMPLDDATSSDDQKRRHGSAATVHPCRSPSSLICQTGKPPTALRERPAGRLDALHDVQPGRQAGIERVAYRDRVAHGGEADFDVLGLARDAGRRCAQRRRPWGGAGVTRPTRAIGPVRRAGSRARTPGRRHGGEMNRSRSRFAYRTRNRCTTGGGGGPPGGLRAGKHRLHGRRAATGSRPVGPIWFWVPVGRAHAAVVARRPPAVVQLAGVQRVLPVRPEPVRGNEPGVEVVPGQHFVEYVAFARRVPVDVDAGACQRDLGG